MQNSAYALIISAFFSFASACVTGYVAYSVAALPELVENVEKVHTAVNSERTESARRERETSELIGELKNEISRITKENIRLEVESDLSKEGEIGK